MSDFTVRPLGRVNAHGHPADFEVIAPPAQAEPPAQRPSHQPREDNHG